MAGKILSRASGSQRHILDDLLQKQGLQPGEYVLFLVSREGIFWPPATEEFEEMSGYVLNKQDQVFAFWVGWDEAHAIPALTEWMEIRAEPHWRDVGEYRRARASLGLPTV
jgi:hypothetical protein